MTMHGCAGCATTTGLAGCPEHGRYAYRNPVVQWTISASRTLVIPDDPEWLAQRLPAHRWCDEHVRGHQSCMDEAARLLAAMKEDS